MAKKRYYSESELVFKEKPTHKNFIDITNETYNDLLVLGYGGKKYSVSAWYCKCNCGNVVLAISSHLKRGLTKSCGCLALKIRTKHGHQIGGKQSRTYNTWRKMIDRCTNKNHKAYHHYGGRGIKIHEEWFTFLNFLNDMGERPINKTLDRIDNNGNYEPSNCRWATKKQQSRNTRTVKKLLFNNIERPLTEWAEIVGINASTINSRLLQYNWSINKALTTPVKK